MQGYAWEITTVEGGWGMDGILKTRQAVLNGIANGIDIVEWNPQTDGFIAQHYSSSDLSGRLSLTLAVSTLTARNIAISHNSSFPLP